jgi:CDP-6-deoxy-D-xylo-4-hexulose-3-dehydrase
MIASLFYTKDKNRQLKIGDEIIVPAVSWSTTYFPLLQYGLKVKFVDIDKDTLNFDMNKLKSAISKDTRMIFACNILGNPNDLKELKNISDKNNLILIEDNCESMGAKFDQKYAGTYGLMGSFSSFYSHHICTMEGGCILTDDEEIYHILLCLRAHGWTRDLPKKNKITGTKSDNFFEESFKFILPGYNVRPLELSGAIGRIQLKKLKRFVEMRVENSKLFKDLFNDHPIFMIQKEIGFSSWFGFSLVIREGVDIDRKEVIEILDNNGIQSRPIVTGNFVNNEVIKYFDYAISEELTNAEIIDKKGFFIGNHHISMKNEIRSVYNLLNTLR